MKLSNTTGESTNQKSVPDISETKTVSEEIEADLVPRKRTKKLFRESTQKETSDVDTISEMAIVEYRPPRILPGFVSVGIIKYLESEGVSSSNKKLKLNDLKMLERRNKGGI